MKILLAILGIFPVVLSTVRAVEEAIPLPGRGKKKLDLVLDVIKMAYEGSSSLAAEFSWDKLVTILVPMIERIVALHNELGLFQTKASEPAKS